MQIRSGKLPKARQREIQLKRQKSGQNFYRLTGLDPRRFPRV